MTTHDKSLPEWQLWRPAPPPKVFEHFTLVTVRAASATDALALARKRFPFVTGLAVSPANNQENLS